MQTLSTAGMLRPEGLDQVGEYWLRAEVISETRLVRYVLWYRQGRETSGTKLGWFILDYLPERQKRTERKVRTHGKKVLVNGKKGACETARVVRVLVDAMGLPVPVDEAIWRAMGLDGGERCVN
jgi:hypothetical protein